MFFCYQRMEEAAIGGGSQAGASLAPATQAGAAGAAAARGGRGAVTAARRRASRRHSLALP